MGIEKLKEKSFLVVVILLYLTTMNFLYSIDDKGSEYFTIFIRRISDGKIVEKIEDTAGGCLWAFDDKSFSIEKMTLKKDLVKFFNIY